MIKRLSFYMAAILLSAALAGCGQTVLGLLLAGSSGSAVAEQPTAIAEPNSTDVVDSLRAAGAEVSIGEMLSQPFFDVTGQIINVNGEDVQVFAFADEAAAAAAAAQISPDGSSTGTTMITWIATPHFYRAGSVIVLYVGDNEEMIALLESVIGPQFAGG